MLVPYQKTGFDSTEWGWKVTFCKFGSQVDEVFMAGLGFCSVSIDRLVAPLRAVLTIAVAAAQAQGWQLYLVGGGVRDLLLAGDGEPVSLSDLDLVVDGVVGAGVKLAEALRSHYPEVKLEIHGKFQTAALTWSGDPVLGDLSMDLATARTERYEYPAANPVVVASSIELDLARRDFSVNAMALRLTNPGAGEVLDFYHGAEDLGLCVLRVLHDRSFVDDPTRIFRGARFASRFGFEFEAGTRELFDSAIGSGIYEQSRSEHRTVPALQARLRSELKYIFQSPHWKGALRILIDLGALQCIHPRLNSREWLDAEGLRRLWRSLCRMEVWLRDFGFGLERWQMMVELVLAVCECDDLIHALNPAVELRLEAGAIDRLARLPKVESEILGALLTGALPSQVYQVLRNYDEASLLLVAARSDDPWRCQIWKYLTQYRSVKPLLSGQDLKSLGYKPGKTFKLMLDQILMATLDGVICDRAGAIVFCRTIDLP
jgi:tRNA nucleotidyltransferase (CCA-adding enzyme)